MMFLALDGPDGAGKSTQLRLLAEHLALGRDVVTCVDPGGTDLGQHLRRLLLGYTGDMTLRSEALLFMASRAQLVAEVIRPALDAGRTVLSDRFVLANVVYQGHAGGLDPAELWHIGSFSSSGLLPDLTLVLDVPLAVSRSRRPDQRDRMERRGEDYHERVRAGFLTEAQRQPARIRVVDATGGIDEVQGRVRQALADWERETQGS